MKVGHFVKTCSQKNNLLLLSKLLLWISITKKNYLHMQKMKNYMLVDVLKQSKV